MTEAAWEARNAYQREWARANPDKKRAARKRYWEKRAKQIETETGRPCTADDAARLYLREWRKRNPDKTKAAQERHWEKKAAETETETPTTTEEERPASDI